MNMKKTSALLGPFSRKVPAILMIVALVAGCNSGVNGNGDAGSDALLPDSDIPDYFGEWDTVILDGSDGEEHVCPEPCGPAGSRQCNGDVIEVCTADAFACMVWQVLQNCADTGQVCDDTGDIPVCVTPETCTDGIKNQDETDVDCGGDVCPPCPIEGECIEDEDCTAPQRCVALTCVDPPAGDTCDDPIVADAFPYTAADVDMAPHRNAVAFEAETCTEWGTGGKDVVYQVALTAGQQMWATVSSDFDAALVIVSDCAATPAADACLAGADEGFAGEDEEVYVQAEGDTTVFVVVDSFAPGYPDTGTFTLTIEVE